LPLFKKQQLFQNQSLNQQYKSLGEVVDPKESEASPIVPQDGVDGFHQTQ
jgi:hypothetical protein